MNRHAAYVCRGDAGAGRYGHRAMATLGLFDKLVQHISLPSARRAGQEHARSVHHDLECLCLPHGFIIVSHIWFCGDENTM